MAATEPPAGAKLAIAGAGAGTSKNFLRAATTPSAPGCETASSWLPGAGSGSVATSPPGPSLKSDRTSWPSSVMSTSAGVDARVHEHRDGEPAAGTRNAEVCDAEVVAAEREEEQDEGGAGGRAHPRSIPGSRPAPITG